MKNRPKRKIVYWIPLWNIPDGTLIAGRVVTKGGVEKTTKTRGFTWKSHSSYLQFNNKRKFWAALEQCPKGTIGEMLHQTKRGRFLIKEFSTSSFAK